jgi:hypothetical protein
MSENTTPGAWEDRPDGSRVKTSNGIRITDRTPRREPPAPVEHLVSWREPGGDVVVMGLDGACRPVNRFTFHDYR